MLLCRQIYSDILRPIITRRFINKNFDAFHSTADKSCVESLAFPVWIYLGRQLRRTDVSSVCPWQRSSALDLKNLEFNKKYWHERDDKKSPINRSI